MKTKRDKFTKRNLSLMPDSFKGLSKKYMMKYIFDEEIQKNWKPQEGDIMVGCTGNVYVISVVENLSERIGGTKYYFGGGGCVRDGSNIVDSTYCFTANESGENIHILDGVLNDPYHSCIRDFRFVPYPHEI